MSHTYYANEMLVQDRIARAQREMEHDRAARLVRASRPARGQDRTPASRPLAWLRGVFSRGITHDNSPSVTGCRP